MKQVILTQDQAITTLQAFDLAIKAGGTQTAAVLLPLVIEIEKQLKANTEKADQSE
jgi:hypothetical protein